MELPCQPTKGLCEVYQCEPWNSRVSPQRGCVKYINANHGTPVSAHKGAVCSISMRTMELPCQPTKGLCAVYQCEPWNSRVSPQRGCVKYINANHGTPVSAHKGAVCSISMRTMELPCQPTKGLCEVYQCKPWNSRVSPQRGCVQYINANHGTPVSAHKGAVCSISMRTMELPCPPTKGLCAVYQCEPWNSRVRPQRGCVQYINANHGTPVSAHKGAV